MTVERHPTALMDAVAAAAVDPERWPDVASVPRCARAHAAAAERAVRRAPARLPIRVQLHHRESLGARGPLMRVHDPGALFRRIGAAGQIGLGESYMAREWDADDLVGLLTVLADDAAGLVPAPLRGLQRLRGRRALSPPESRPHSTPRSTLHATPYRQDLPKELFASFLDQTMTYSSAVFGGFPADRAELPAAQHRKIDRLLDLAAVGPGTQLLELGTGWGELAIRAAGRGARVLSVTSSREEYELARWRIEQAGLTARATVLLRDFRRVIGSFDAIVSVEMAETLGAESWPVYFTALDRMLAAGGRVALQTVTMPHDRMLASLSAPTWVGKYIRPGGRIPSAEAIEQIIAAHTDLRIAGRETFGAHYAETLRLWRERFTERAAEELAPLGFDETFRRMWTFHLAAAEAGFRSRQLDVQHLLLTPDEVA
ncbi:class I SAM-dependent methyltransferase [Streptomyces sp. 8N616]|uniref:class I SAM-dependent methyltransferase n=1 Tax=Streptomyces sp. 8N616 TaxID=3457414 RepID=UPI003FD0A29A